ncbi:MAG: hypothetical protein K6U08_08960, partial [Firmicutes bacterium]|nr:hypothetical protein [Bacillota bacterium]
MVTHGRTASVPVKETPQRAAAGWGCTDGSRVQGESPAYLAFWGKTAWAEGVPGEGCPRRWLPLLYHMLDVFAVAEALWST